MNTGKDSINYWAYVEQLRRLLGIVKQGGSVLLCGEFGQQMIQTAERYPEELFRLLDADWQTYAHQVTQDGLDLLGPPVLGIVLTRCARRDAIPTVIRDLRDEWANARNKVWDLLDHLRRCRTLDEASEIRKELSEAPRLFSPNKTDADTRPVRVFWGDFGRGWRWRDDSAVVRR